MIEDKSSTGIRSIRQQLVELRTKLAESKKRNSNVIISSRESEIILVLLEGCNVPAVL